MALRSDIIGSDTRNDSSLPTYASKGDQQIMPLKQDAVILVIDPQTELKFEGPYNLPANSFIKLTNVTDKKVHFKLKTTAPKRYCVRPNSGVLNAKGVVEVQVVLQPFNYNAADKYKHKFMVQFMVEPEGCIMSPDELWKSIAPDKILNYKLKCVFEMPLIPGNEQQEPPPENTTVVTEEKAKKVVVDNNKTSSAKTALMGNGGELQKVAAEVKQLRDEESKLQQENLALKEELYQLRQKISGKEAKRNTYTPPATQLSKSESGPVPLLTYIAISVLVAFLSFLIGRFNC